MRTRVSGTDLTTVAVKEGIVGKGSSAAMSSCRGAFTPETTLEEGVSSEMSVVSSALKAGVLGES